MDMVKVIEAPKEKFTWIGPLRKLEEVDVPIYFWYADRGKVAPLISSDIRLEFPDRGYKTEKSFVKDPETGKELELLKVWREK